MSSESPLGVLGMWGSARVVTLDRIHFLWDCKVFVVGAAQLVSGMSIIQSLRVIKCCLISRASICNSLFN